MPNGPNSDRPATATPARLAATIDDVLLPDAARLDDRARSAIRALLREAIDGIERDVRRHAARLLAVQGDDGAAEALVAEPDTAFVRLAAADVLRDPEIMAEAIAQGRLALIAARLPMIAQADARPPLLPHLAAVSDPAVQAAARAAIAADDRASFPAELHHRLVWAVAAAVRPAAHDIRVDRALVEAVRRCLAEHDEGRGAATLAARLAAALDPLSAEVPALLVAALDDRRLMLFVALLARTLGIDADTVRAMVIDPADGDLWWALRGVGVERDDIARIALALAEADSRRDVDALADRLGAVAATTPEAARASLAPLTLPRDFRLAAERLETAR